MATTEQALQEQLSADISVPSENQALIERTLTEMQFSDAAKQLILNPTNTPPDSDSLQGIILTQEHLIQVKKSLGAIVDSLHENPSIISRAAKFWGEIPLWQRILGGVAISGPTLVIGAAAHIGFLVTMSGISVFAYATGGILLEDHHYHSKKIAARLKEGIFGVAEVLELTICALDSIRQKLAYEVDRFKKENDELKSNICELNNEVTTLSIQVEVFVKTETLLRQQKIALEGVATRLQQDVQTQHELITANQSDLANVKQCHEQSIRQLSEKAAELKEVRKSMGDEIDRLKAASSTLETTIMTLSKAMISDASQRESFQQKLSSFLSDQTTNFGDIVARMGSTEKEISEIKAALKTSNEQYKKLLAFQEQLIRRLELLDQTVDLSIHPELAPPGTKIQESITVSELLKKFGLLLSKPLFSSTSTQEDPKPQEPSDTKKTDDEPKLTQSQ